jgi:hypothetical protein
MSADRDVTRIVRSWLHEDAYEDADRILNLVLDEIDTTPQRQAGWLARRIPMLSTYARYGLVAAAVILALAVGIGLYSRSGVGGPPPEASTSSAPSLMPSPTPLATPSPLPEGDYQTAPIPTATLKATAEAAGFAWDAAKWPEASTVYMIRLESGRLLWYCSADGATAAICSKGTYVVTDDHTVTYTDAQDTSSGFILTFSLDGNTLTTHVDSGPGCGIECVIFFNSAPFVRQP